MKTENIKAIFTNLLFVIGVIFLIVGFITGAQTVTRMALFEQYPLNSYDETRCDFEPMPLMIEKGGQQITESSTETELRREKCLSSLAHERKIKQTEDIVTSITSLVAGAALVISFRKFIFK